MKLLGRLVDERFLEYRRRSTSVAGILGGAFALLLFEWRLFVNHRLEWDLLAVGLVFVVVKLALMTWYYLNR